MYGYCLVYTVYTPLSDELKSPEGSVAIMHVRICEPGRFVDKYPLVA